MDFQELNRQIKSSDIAAAQLCRARWNAIAKPIGSLGLLEEAVIKIAALTGSDLPFIQHRAVLVLCADNGVVAEGVTQTGSEITALVAKNIAQGHACIRYMAKRAGADVLTVDMGMNQPPDDKGILDYAVARGTKNFAKETAMTVDQAKQAIRCGMELVLRCKQQGYQLLATGEMGIGNTTTASAISAVLLGKAVSKVTGRGAGLGDQAMRKKIRVIQAAVRLHAPDSEDSFCVLQTLGGLDIAGLTGVYLGGALYRVPVLIDGFISSVAALLAARLCPNSVQAMFATHVSSEPAAAMVLEAIGLKPMITAEMHLGEGTGAVCAIPLLDMALEVYKNMATFEQIGMDAYEVPDECKESVTVK
ncbi:MAG TPA: nicotinate-nucleotide--dimethylbenzimidazole phosphoribosyltransferase [Clostridia bacterium]|nr:nicotinate-nucleotide--dimethylbenzimidazole phosphoribosyltransferase [Clostridia bacterium]